MVGDHVHVPDPDNPVRVEIIPHAPEGPGREQIQRQNTEVSRAEYDRLLMEKQAQDLRLERLERQMTATTAPPQYSTMTKTTIPVPTLEKGMSWMEYKFNMNIWKQGRPVAPEQMGWCLLNALPKSDDRCLKQRIVAAIRIEALGEEDGAEKLINELGELIRNLMWATSAYNQATMTTGFSPAQLMFGVTNSDLSVQDFDVMDMQEMACDRSYRFMEDFRIRREARESHLIVKNRQKLKQVLLRKSNPSVENKPIGTYVWVKRNGQWIGMGRVCHSLGSEAGVKMAKGWLTCKMGDLMRLNHSELVKHGLGGQEHEEICGRFL